MPLLLFFADRFLGYPLKKLHDSIARLRHVISQVDEVEDAKRKYEIHSLTG
jgi:hypothetical protein